MNDEVKTQILNQYLNMAFNTPNAYMWFAISAGILSGKPITPDEYYQLQTATLPEHANILNTERFIFLKDVNIRTGDSIAAFNLTVLDMLEISAWGFFNPSNVSSFRT